MINHLPITTRGKDRTIVVPEIGTVKFREFFAPIEKDLRKLIKNRGKKFEKLRGIKSYTRIQEYHNLIMDTISEKPPDSRITKILASTASKMEKCLTHELWVELSNRLYEFLGGITLAQFANRPGIHELAIQRDKINGRFILARRQAEVLQQRRQA